MKILLIVAGALALALTGCRSEAADLNKPNLTPEQIMALPNPSATSCYVETSVAGTFLRNAREAQAGIGGGCDTRLYNLIIGGGLRADIADWRNTGSVFAKIGIVLNAGAHLYGLAEWKVPEWKIKDAGQLALGAGGEIKLEIIHPNLWIFSEASFAATKWGRTTEDDLGIRAGLRFRY